MTSGANPNPYDETNPEYNVRTDLWATMSLQELQRQHELVCIKLNTVHGMISGPHASMSMIGIFHALQHATDVLTELINKTGK